MGYLDEFPLPLIFATSIVIMLAATEAGRWLGLRARGNAEDNIPAFQSAMFGLVALMIGFTFAMALSRYEARREAVLNEANAIAATALRARLLPAPYDADAVRMLREYTRLRVTVIGHLPSEQERAASLARSNALQDELWRQTMAGAAKADPTVPSWLVFDALNDLISAQRKRLAIIRDQVPNEVMLTLYGIAALTIGFAGYAQGLKGGPPRLPVYLMALLVCSVIALIEDIETPFTGFIAVSQQPLIDVAAQLAGGATPPR